MGKQSTTQKIFKYVLQNAKDVTDTFDVNLGDIPQDVVASRQQAEPHIKNVRQLMEEKRLEPDTDLSNVELGLIDMSEWVKVHGEPIREALKSGDVVAIDGTPLLQLQRFLTTQVYACAIGTLTYRDNLALKAQVVKTQASQELFQDIDATTRHIKETERLSSSRSWPAAFLEYKERQTGYNHHAKYVLIDGPLITQNLLTQTEGRELYTKMLGVNRKCYVGVTKDLRFADTEERYEAVALHAGELFIRNTEYNVMRERLEKDYRGAVKTWSEDYLRDIFRGIYKPGRKAFGFQCHRDDLPLVVCLLSMDCHPQPGHEIPFLLEQVDAKIRGRYRPTETMSAIEATLARHNMDEFYDETEERMFRK
ncbi:MAG: hypothetical protein BWK78_05215 [Thiotrichaceae bacterium IS1]|nr:MAG: hypothetical protein BWK78_05215 [Thiotrichaceae bacterium IS1]